MAALGPGSGVAAHLPAEHAAVARGDDVRGAGAARHERALAQHVARPVEAHVDAKRTTRKAASQEAAAAHAREQRKKEKERLAQIEEQLRKQTLSEQIARGDLM